MSDQWIKARTDLAENPKTIAIAVKLGCDPYLVVGKLVGQLWKWADKHAALFRGDDPHYQHAKALGTAAWVDQHTGIKGLADAMMAAGIDWLRVEGDYLIFPRWEKHNGKSAKMRAENTRRQQRLRDNPAPTDAEPVAPVVAPEARQTSRTTRDTSATREEKKREEKRTPPPASCGLRPAACGDDAARGGGGGGVGDRDEVTRCQGDQVPGDAGSTPDHLDTSAPLRTPEAAALLDTLIGAGVWTSVAEAAIDQAGVELVGAVVAEWGKLPKPTPELLGARLREVVKPGSDIRKCAEAYLAKIAERKARAQQRNLQLVRPDRSAERPSALGNRPSSPGHLATSAPSVPGITDHPAFAKIGAST